MSRPKIIKKLKLKHPKLNRPQIEIIIDTFFQNIEDALTEKKTVYLRGFGTFLAKERKEKTGRNISKNTTIIIPAHHIPSFKPAKVFKEEVKEKVK